MPISSFLAINYAEYIRIYLNSLIFNFKFLPLSFISNHVPAYSTNYGETYLGDSLVLLNKLENESIDLVITSPPFALLRKKEYGNRDQHEYIKWLSSFAELVYKKLRSTGSFVIDIGGAYQQGIPVRSLYNFRVPIHFCDNLGFFLAEDFYWFNPSKLPSPIEWVNKRKIRAKDAVNNVWWFSKTPFPKANISNVLVPYSDRMKKLLNNPEAFYTPKSRPSGHDIKSSFSINNGGAIPSNLLQISNAESNTPYLSLCKKLNIKSHPARFPLQLPEFFIKLLTDKGDTVVDIFSGSNATGLAAEKLNRRWIAMDLDKDYVATSSFRFLPRNLDALTALKIYYSIIENPGNIDIIQAQTSNLEISDVIKSKIEKKLAILKQPIEHYPNEV